VKEKHVDKRHKRRIEADWKAGPPPPCVGRWWIVWAGDDGPRVLLIDVGPATFVPNGKLLMKIAGGIAYEFDANTERMTHHAPVPTPDLPKGVPF
jgi:hypothetical protein